MSKIDELVARISSDGVRHLVLADPDVAHFGTGRQLNRSTLSSSGDYPVFNGGIGTSGWHSDFNTEGPAIAVSQGGASAGYVNYIAGRFWAGAHCYVVTPGPAVDRRYLYYVLKGSQAIIQAAARGAGIPGLARGALGAISVPVPPLELQREIVRVLDQFTQLEAELEAELEARRRQYAHYQGELLTFPETGARWVPLGDLLREPLANGRSVPDGLGYPVLRLTALHGRVVDVNEQKLGAWDAAVGSRFRIEAGDILVARGNGSKELLARACMVEATEEVAFPDTMIRIRPDLNVISQRYLFHIWESHSVRASVEQKAKASSGVWKVNQDDLASIVLPVPSRSEQQRVVSILDKFDALVNDLSFGLPAELNARRTQYEYYRDTLLTFEEAAS